MRVCNACQKQFLGMDNDPCPRCGGHGLDNNGARAWNPDWRWLLEAIDADGESHLADKLCNSLDECRLWSASYQADGMYADKIKLMNAICVQTGEVVSMEVFK